MSGVHARDGQRHDALTARLRDTWVRARKRLRSALAWYLNVDDWRRIPGDVRALNAVLLDAIPLISRRAGRAAGGAPAATPLVAGAPEAPAPAVPAPGAGASPDHLWPGDPVTAPAGSRRTSREAKTRATASRQGTQLRYADPEAPAAPASPGAARPPWDTWPPPSRTMPDNAGRGAAGRRETIAMAALRDPVPPYYRAHLAAQDMAVSA